MASYFFNNANAPTKILFSVFIVLSSLFIFSILALILAMPLFGLSLSELMSLYPDLTNSSNVGLLKYFQIVQSIGVFVVPPFILAYFFGKGPKTYLHFSPKYAKGSGLLVLILMIIILPLINLLAEMNASLSLPEFLDPMEKWMKQMEDSAERLTEMFLTTHSAKDFLVNFIMIAILPALGEELMFRGIVQRLFREWTKNAHWAIFIAAFLFSAIHLQFYGFLPRLLLGMLFGYLYVWSSSIWLPILAHFINNAMAVILYTIFSSQQIEKSIDSLGTSQNMIILSFFSLILTIFIIRTIYQKEQITSDKGNSLSV
jgi:hypothetical protein